MTWCVAVGCDSNSYKKDRKKVKFFRFPKDDVLKKKWIQIIRRENLPKDPSICELHFDEISFERDMEVSKIIIFQPIAID